jgi:small-conductance mechanosensitive channel
MNESTNLEVWGQAIETSFSDILVRLANFIPDLVGAALLLIVGWLLALLVENVIDRLLRVLNIPRLFERARVEDLVKRTGTTRDTVGLISGLFKWIVMVVFFIAAANALGLDAVSVFLNSILGYMPNVIAAIAIILVGGILAQFMAEVVRGTVSAANLGYASFLASVTRWTIWIFAILTALFQLNVAAGIIENIITGLVAAFALAIGLSFGLGGQKAAAEFLEKVRKDLQ